MSEDLPSGNGLADHEAGDEEREPIREYPRLLSYRAALLLFAALAVLAAFTLTGKLRIFVLILDAGLALKVVLFHFREKLDDANR